MLLQFFEMFQIYYLLGVVVLVAVWIAVNLCLQHAQHAEKHIKEESTGLLAEWWKWINSPAPDLGSLFPKYTTDKHIESWLCPICGSKIAKNDVEKLEYGYNIECKYCGATISFTNAVVTLSPVLIFLR